MNIGSIALGQPLCLAPMDDVTDRSFRRLCKEFGAEVVYTEFVPCEAVTRNIPIIMSKMGIDPAEQPAAVQLYGSNEDAMERAAAAAERAAPSFIDINCGCWVRKIAARGDGAGLLRDLKKLTAVVRAAMRGTALPVTVKTRLGWDAAHIVILELAPMLEDLGVAALTVHCRTRAQGYTGTADWSWLPRIREVTRLPLIANGDITHPEHARHCLDLGADGVMIGRGAIGAPWIFRRMRHYLDTGEVLPEPDLAARIEICLRHLRDQVLERGERRGVLSFRRNYALYLKGAPFATRARKDIMAMTEVAAVEERLYRFLDECAQLQELEPEESPCSNL